jgi:hypothetical protein
LPRFKPDERINSTLTQLDQWFSGLRNNFEKGTTKVWMEDEWSRGAWAFAGIGNLLLFGTPEDESTLPASICRSTLRGFRARWSQQRPPSR